MNFNIGNSELKNERINVRATKSMKTKMKIIKLYLEQQNNRKYSDSEIIEILIDTYSLLILK